MSNSEIDMRNLKSPDESSYRTESIANEDSNESPSLRRFSRVSRGSIGRSKYHADEQEDTPLLARGTHGALQPQSIHPASLVSTLTWWIPELVASVLSIASFCSIVGVLLTFNGRAAAEIHLPRYLTLNGLIAAIATINRACLTAPVCSAVMQEMWLYFASEAKKASSRSCLYDLSSYTEASSGAVGSLKFLAHARGRRLIACLGCLITILSLAYGTFIQQLVGLAVLPAQNAALPGNVPWTQSWNTDGILGIPPLAMIAAIHNGIFGGMTEPLQASCPTGNCAWPPTSSLAICGACANSTFERVSCNTDHLCNFTTPVTSPSSVVMYDLEHYSGADTNLSAVPGFIVLPEVRGAIFNISTDKRSYLANMDIFGAPYDSNSQSTLPYTNTECALWWCVQEYQTRMDSGVQRQIVTQTIEDSYASEQANGSTPDWIVFPGPSDAQQPTNFTIGSRDNAVLESYFLSIFNNSVSNVVWLDKNGSDSFENDLILGVWKGTTDPDRWIASLAMSMTNAIRSTNSSSIPQYDGTSNELSLTVRWQWLILPAALVFLSIVFLFTVIIRTASAPVRSWKGSPLTLLLFDLDENVKEAGRSQMDKRDGVDKAIGKRNFRYVADDTGARRFKAC